ncbi:MAG TPA: hypothetical protein VEZ20_09555 [Allosphingosinicella sp.]|jgi:hypothetical protein|nr:hypothetical protein [Allosphingosinicella sp.]
MSMLELEFAEATKEGRLHAKFVRECQWLLLSSPFKRSLPHGINVDALIILDFDAEKRLAKVEILEARRHWHKKLCWPLSEKVIEADLKIVDCSKPDRLIELAIWIGAEGKRVDVRIGSGSPDRLVRLSDSVLAVMDRKRLIGFSLQVADLM